MKNLNKKINSNKTKHLLVENKFEKLQTFDSIYFCGKSHFEDECTQNSLVFQTTERYFQTVSNNDGHIVSWESKGLSDESIKPRSTFINVVNPSLNMLVLKVE